MFFFPTKLSERMLIFIELNRLYEQLSDGYSRFPAQACVLPHALPVWNQPIHAWARNYLYGYYGLPKIQFDVWPMAFFCISKEWNIRTWNSQSAFNSINSLHCIEPYKAQWREKKHRKFEFMHHVTIECSFIVRTQCFSSLFHKVLWPDIQFVWARNVTWCFNWKLLQ